MWYVGWGGGLWGCIVGLFLGAKAPLELAHVKNENNNGTEIFLIAYVCICGARWTCNVAWYIIQYFHMMLDIFRRF